MNDQGTFRFFPTPVVWLGVTMWLTLTTAASWAEIVANNYELPVIVFGVAITAFAMACVTAWASLLTALAVNWLVNDRRSMFRKPLLECSAFFGFITALAVWSVFYVDS
ncbi:hypothetical protein [Allorhodopirellula heiligendammensis]|uniref:Uncharacterized protein n=1 Tax=Allorhodopirellula heiligendammensis TaxID=2714739 RepID=A0A5C6C3A5_9BACT|nr:hypothetical protein [Allorhodopirellula heiligendammensis]TWU18497.1 hypothetical protein Poly21_06600 [Allorhodopirellula heiligendammensis]